MRQLPLDSAEIHRILDHIEIVDNAELLWIDRLMEKIGSLELPTKIENLRSLLLPVLVNLGLLYLGWIDLVRSSQHHLDLWEILSPLQKLCLSDISRQSLMVHPN